jgi:hypothetical protein
MKKDEEYHFEKKMLEHKMAELKEKYGILD